MCCIIAQLHSHNVLFRETTTALVFNKKGQDKQKKADCACRSTSSISRTMLITLFNRPRPSEINGDHINEAHDIQYLILFPPSATTALINKNQFLQCSLFCSCISKHCYDILKNYYSLVTAACISVALSH